MMKWKCLRNIIADLIQLISLLKVVGLLDVVILHQIWGNLIQSITHFLNSIIGQSHSSKLQWECEINNTKYYIILYSMITLYCSSPQILPWWSSSLPWPCLEESLLLWSAVHGPQCSHRCYISQYMQHQEVWYRPLVHQHRHGDLSSYGRVLKLTLIIIGEFSKTLSLLTCIKMCKKYFWYL